MQNHLILVGCTPIHYNSLIQFTDLLQIRETAHKNTVELKVLEKYIVFITNFA